MKTLLAVVAAFLSFQSQAATPSAELCVERVMKQYLPVIDVPNRVDKYKHCSASCVLALKCGVTEAWIAGVGKEVLDVFNHGDPDIKDLEADGAGIRQARRGYAKTAEDCLYRCGRIFPEPVHY